MKWPLVLLLCISSALLMLAFTPHQGVDAQQPAKEAPPAVQAASEKPSAVTPTTAKPNAEGNVAPNGIAAAPAVGDVRTPAPWGELIYVPIYSHIYYENNKNTLELTAMLSIHNVNVERTITVIQADYFDTQGRLIHRYLPEPLVLRPLETKHIVIEKTNTAGGAGANFLVEWQSHQEVNSPLVEALMVNASHNLGISFTSTGRVIKRFPAAAK